MDCRNGQDSVQEIEEFVLDEQGFSRIYSQFYDSLKRVAYRYIPCEQLAEEVVSDVFFKIWNKREELGSIQKVQSYLYVAVRNQSFNYLQKFRKVRFCDIEDVSGNYFSGCYSPEDHYLQQELEDKVEDAISLLPNRCGLIYRMVRIDGMKHKQVSEELGISVKTIEVQIGIALKRMHKSLHPYFCREAS